MPILIYDANGSLVMQLREQKPSGKKAYTISLAKLAKGKYFIKVFDGDQLVGVTEMIKL